ncbi:MAG: DUF2760 domain-containing protein [Methylococcaceae bacterium]|jgi:hypothetical protein|nr:DUF2760 domain-containing protein [Methylococcaceae bacterium]
MNNLTIDLALQPSVLDAWHVALGATAAIAILLTLIFMLAWLAARSRAKHVAQPQIKVVEKVVEVEKIVEVSKPAVAPEPIILKEASSDAALQLLAILQKEARFLDFIQEDMTAYSDADIGAAARIVHQGCTKAIQEHFVVEPVSTLTEGAPIVLQDGFDAAAYRLIGNISGSAPFNGTLVHRGWRIAQVKLPQLTQTHDAHIIAAAEVEL